MHLTVLYFAAARERTGTDRETAELPAGACVRELRESLAARHPALAPLLSRVRFAVNREFVNEDAALSEGDEVALIPPVAGGAGNFVVTPEPLSLQSVVEAVSGPGRGGLVTFTGAVRDHSRGRRVVRLQYEAYVPMAEAKLEEIGREIEARWPGTRVAIHHRIGTLQIGEAAVVIAVSGAHRRESFEGCSHAIERLKEDVPIWKKERYEDGEEWVGLGP